MLSVGLPIFKSKNIAWLCLESLCNQKNITFEWELIVMEESSGAFGDEKLSEFANRLKAVGCTSIRYIELEYHVNLATKWRMLAEKSKYDIFCFCSADDYYEPYKLSKCVEVIGKGHDWFGYEKCLFYDIPTKRTMLFDSSLNNWAPGMIAACRTRDLLALPKTFIASGVDYYLYTSIKPANPFIYRGEDYKSGFATDGMNTISLTRKRHYDNPTIPFVKTDLSIIVTERIKGMLNLLSRDIKEFPKAKELNVVAVIPVYGRLTLLAHTISRLYNKNKLIKVICVGKSIDEKILCESLGAEFVEHDNNPLGKKWNAGFMAAKKYNPDACLFVGSSDWVSDNWIEVMGKYLDNFDLVGTPNFYMADIGHSVRACHWEGYEGKRSSEPIGIGRLLSKRILDKLDWQPMDDKLNNSLDASMFLNVKHIGGDVLVVRDDSIKSLSISTNLWINKHKFEDHYLGKLKSERINVEVLENDFEELKNINLKALV